MKITVQSVDLKKYLGIAIRGIGNRPQLPILSGILLKVSENEVNLVSTDLEIGFWVRIPAKIDEIGDIVVPAKLFVDLISGLPVGNVELTSEKDVLKVVAKGINSSLVGQSAEEYPSIPRFKESQIQVGGGDFRFKSDRVCVSAARDDTRPVLTGVLWEIGGQNVSLVATDGYRLGVDTLKVKKNSLDKSTRFILPARSMQEVSRVLSETGEDVFNIEFDKDNQQVIFLMADIELSSRLISGEFPPYQQIMPNTYTVRALLNRDDLLEAVKRASLFARDSANIIKLTLEKSALTVRAESSQVGSNSTEIGAEIEGEGLTVAFNARYLLDYLGVNNSKEIVWETEGDLKPSVFKRNDEDDWLQVVMPVKMQS